MGERELKQRFGASCYKAGFENGYKELLRLIFITFSMLLLLNIISAIASPSASAISAAISTALFGLFTMLVLSARLWVYNFIIGALELWEFLWCGQIQ